jgi:hypothetical protein
MTQLLEFKYTSYLDFCTKEYKKVIYVNLMPEDLELKKLIKIDKRPKLSPFHITDTKCMYFILNPNNTGLLELENVGLLFNFLTKNGFNLLSTFSEIVKKDPKFICYASK